jgi:hypothetical protein
MKVTKHLSRLDLLELVDGAANSPGDGRAKRHLEVCAACRGEVDALRAVLLDAENVPHIEPSPLFWGHFATRVSEAVRDEMIEAADERSVRWFAGPGAAWAAGLLLVVLATTATWRATLHAPTGAGPVAAVWPGGGATFTDDVEGDRAWGIVRAAAESSGWDDEQAEGITARPGSADGVALELSDAERAELVRLIEGELRRGGA